ncbi:MAG: M14 family metallopeptidase [Pseudobdellovibrionaceae bacterium]
MNNIPYFIPDYYKSRDRFLKETKTFAPSSKVGSWAIPQKNGPDLFVDHFWIPPKEKSETLFVISSGIHGNEGPAGSAIQSMFMNEFLSKMDFTNTGLFMVHSMNPYGYVNRQRCTEAKVNLNRNFSVSGELFKTKNPKSKHFHERFLETKPVSSMTSKFLSLMQKKNGVPYIDDVPLDEFIKACVPGQFERPDHLEYGGHACEPQTQHFIEAVRTLMKDFKDVIGLDLHTGLGHAGRLHLLTDGDEKTCHEILFNQTFNVEADKEFYEFTPATEEGFYEVHGALNSGFRALIRDDQRLCSLTMEFGTLGHSFEKQMESFNSFLLTHQGTSHGYATPEIEKTVKTIDFAKSYVDTDEWKNSVMNASRGMFERILKRTRSI